MIRQIARPFIFAALALCAVSPLSSEGKPAAEKPAAVRFDPVLVNVEGWVISVDPSLMSGEYQELGSQALKMLANHLQRIVILIPEKQLAELRKVGIWLERDHPLKSMQYHPDLDWLEENGHDPRLVKKVHIPRAEDLLSRHEMLKHPAVILHELAHAHHDQVLGFDDAGILAAYDKAMKAGIYEKSLLYTGEVVKHYATTNHKEYFAESTEAYFYHNDFYPFVRAQLKQHDPTMYAEMERVWGKIDK